MGAIHRALGVRSLRRPGGDNCRPGLNAAEFHPAGNARPIHPELIRRNPPRSLTLYWHKLNIICEVCAALEFPTRSRLAAQYQHAREHGADLIVIGTHGRGAVARALLGSTTERVVRRAPCPVLVVRQREQDFVKE